MTKIGFVGLGHMGAPMAKNLIKAGYQLIVYDVQAAATEQFLDTNVTIAKSLAELAAASPIIITMLQTGEQVKQVCLEQHGLYTYAAANSLFIDCSTIDVTSSRLLHKFAEEADFKSVDAPVSGGVVSATNATLTFMVGGADEAFNLALPILQAMGKKIIHAGVAGNGQVAKICNNMILGISMAAISEAYTLGEKLGLDPKKFFEISSNASGQCWAMTNYSPVPNLIENVPANNHYKPGFTAKMMLKDLHLSQQAAENIGFATNMGAAATKLYEQFVAEMDDELDFSGIIKMIAGGKFVL